MDKAVSGRAQGVENPNARWHGERREREWGLYRKQEAKLGQDGSTVLLGKRISVPSSHLHLFFLLMMVIVIGYLWCPIS